MPRHADSAISMPDIFAASRGYRAAFQAVTDAA